MSKTSQPQLRNRLANSIAGVKIVLRRPKYLLLAIISGFFMAGFIIWTLNLPLAHYIITEPSIIFVEKIRFFWDVQTGIYTAYDSPQASGMLIFGYLFGVNISMIVFALRNGSFKYIPKKSGFSGLLLAIIGSGCVACGTSILAPFLATIGATSVAVSAELSSIFNWLGSLLIIYSIYKLGSTINNTSKIYH